MAKKMKHLIMICNLEDIQYDNLFTSSSRYELNFAYGLSELIERVSIVSPKSATDFHQGNITLYACTSGDLIYEVEPIIGVTRGLIDINEETVVLFWGYNPILLNALCKLKSKHTKVVTMVYDTHLGELSNKRFYKKFLIKLFYFWGIIQINRLDAVFLFKKAAIKRLRIKIKNCVILPTVDLKLIEPFTELKSNSLTFLYSGTLCEYNGIHELLAAFMDLDAKNIFLKIYGNGPLEKEVLLATKKDYRIVYGGRISNRELSREITQADVLLNLRKVPSVVNDIAFPSKVVEYMSAGKAVMSTNVSESKEFGEAVFLLTDLDKSTIVSMMEYICSHKEEFKDKVKKSFHYLELYHNNDITISKIYEFMFKELFYD